MRNMKAYAILFCLLVASFNNLCAQGENQPVATNYKTSTEPLMLLQRNYDLALKNIEICLEKTFDLACVNNNLRIAWHEKMILLDFFQRLDDLVILQAKSNSDTISNEKYQDKLFEEYDKEIIPDICKQIEARITAYKNGTFNKYFAGITTDNKSNSSSQTKLQIVQEYRDDLEKFYNNNDYYGRLIQDNGCSNIQNIKEVPTILISIDKNLDSVS